MRNSLSGSHETKESTSVLRRIRDVAVLLVPAIVAFLVQAPSLSHGFMADDFLIILGNPQITEPSSASALLLPFAAGAVVTVLGGALRRSLLAFSATSISVVAALLVRFAVLEAVPQTHPLAGLPLGLKLAAVLKAVGSYALSLLAGRPIVRLPQVPDGFFDPGVLLGVGLLLLLAGVLVSTRLRSPSALGVVILGASLAPALAIWHIRIPMWKAEIPIAERWLYLPAAGAALLAADRIAPWLPEHRWQLADVLLALGRPKEAVAVLERLLSPEFRFDPAGIAQRIDMGNDSLERLHADDTWRFLARAREAAGDEAGARDALARADDMAGRTRHQPVPTTPVPTRPSPASGARPD